MAARVTQWRAVAAAMLVSVVLLPGANLAAAAPLDVLIAQCAGCHSADQGRPIAPEIPTLGGQPELFVLYQLVYFRQGQRKETAMNDMLRELGDDDLRALATYVATLPPPSRPDGKVDAARYRRGASLAKRNRCPTCHNADYSGREHLPRLAAQQEQYLLQAMQDYKQGSRIGIQASMPEVLSQIDDAGLRDLAHYLTHFRQ